VDSVRAAILAGEVGGAATRNEQDLVGLFRDGIDGQRHCRVRHIDDDTDTILVKPLPGGVGADVGLVLVIGGDHFNRHAGDRAAVILDRHAGRDDGSGAGEVGLDAGLVVQHADLQAFGTRRRRQE
jgi:hypothetical protein